MLKKLLVGLVVIGLIVLIFIFPGESMNTDDLNSYVINKAYLAKNGESYARCYNSVNYGTSGLIDVELSLKSEYFNDPRVSYEKIKEVEDSFLNSIKQRCDKIVSDYESAYKKTDEIQKKSESLSMGWRTLLLGGNSQSISSNEISSYSPTSARMTVAFNDYVFTYDEARKFYKEKLGL